MQELENCVFRHQDPEILRLLCRYVYQILRLHAVGVLWRSKLSLSLFRIWSSMTHHSFCYRVPFAPNGLVYPVGSFCFDIVLLSLDDPHAFDCICQEYLAPGQPVSFDHGAHTGEQRSLAPGRRINDISLSNGRSISQDLV